MHRNSLTHIPNCREFYPGGECRNQLNTVTVSRQFIKFQIIAMWYYASN